MQNKYIYFGLSLSSSLGEEPVVTRFDREVSGSRGPECDFVMRVNGERRDDCIIFEPDTALDEKLHASMIIVVVHVTCL